VRQGVQHWGHQPQGLQAATAAQHQQLLRAQRVQRVQRKGLLAEGVQEGVQAQKARLQCWQLGPVEGDGVQGVLLVLVQEERQGVLWVVLMPLVRACQVVVASVLLALVQEERQGVLRVALMPLATACQAVVA
jgi:hypothetical protein